MAALLCSMRWLVQVDTWISWWEVTCGISSPMGTLVRSSTTYTKCVGFLSLSLCSTYGYLYHARTVADSVATHCSTYLMISHLLRRPPDSVPYRQIGLEGRYQRTTSSAQHVYNNRLVLLETCVATKHGFFYSIRFASSDEM